MKPVNGLHDTLAIACRTREGARAIAPTLANGVAREALAWATANAARADLVLAPLIDGIAAAGDGGLRALAIEAAAARLARGETIYDALACLPRAYAAGRVTGTVRRRVDALCWELAARGDGMPSLGAWLARDPAAVRDLVTDGRTRELRVRARAARVLAVIADGIADDLNLPLASQLAELATAWMADPEPHVWTHAARALGRLAGRVATARRALHAWTASPLGWQQRRIAAAIGAVPQHHASDWIDDTIAAILAPAAVVRDPWRVAALGAAAPNLARDHAAHWQVLLELAYTGPLEVAWGAAQGLAALGRHGGGRGLSASEREAVIEIRARVSGLPRRSTDEAARAHSCEIELGRALGEAAPAVLVLEATDDALRTYFAGRGAAPSSVTPRDAYTAATAALGAPDESTRGVAHAILRSATRAHALGIHELLEAATGEVGTSDLGPRTSADDEAPSELSRSAVTSVLEPAATSVRGPRSEVRGLDFSDMVLSDASARLAKEICEYGLRATLVACLGDIVDGAAAHGPVAARALRAIAASRWARQEIVDGPDGVARAKAIRRFRKPLEDLFDRATPRGASAPGLHASGAAPETAVAGPIAAWWALCGGGGALIAELERDLAKESPVRTALAAIDRALHDAACGLSASRWSEQVAEALATLGAADTLLARAIARLAAAVDLLGAAQPATLAQALVPLAPAVEMMLAVASDLDAAMLVDRAPDAPEGAIAPLEVERRRRRRDGALDDTTLARWEAELPPALATIVMPLARGAQRALGETIHVGRGMVIGGFELVERLGGGGMGEVWKARRGRQLVALKLPHPDAAPADRAHLAELLRAEALRLEGVSIAKVVTFIEAGVDGEIPYLATAYLRGRTLYEHALETPGPRAALDLALVRRIARDTITGLANLHELGVVHRDVTPRNVFLRFRGQDPAPIPTLVEDPQGRRIDEAVLVDLGISQRIADRASPHASVGYAAPEILAGAPVGPAADIYGLGATLFHALTGRRFASGLPASRAITWHITSDPFDDVEVRTAAAAAQLPAPLVDVLRAATRLDPADRITLEAFDAELA